MKIRYKVRWYDKDGRKKVTRFKNGELEWDGNWDDDNHDGLRKLIMEENPRTHIVGYGPDDADWNEFEQSIASVMDEKQRLVK
jgi:hypothetical protein